MSEPIPPANGPGFAQSTGFSAIRTVGSLTPFIWVKKGFADLIVCQFASLFYGVAFALMGWTVAFFYGAAYWLTLAAMGAFMLAGPIMAIGLYALSRQRERGEEPHLRPTLSCWRGNMSNLGLFALVVGVVMLIWARASMVVFAVLYDTGLPSAENFISELLAFKYVEFVVTYLAVGGIFACFIFATSVVAVPLMFDKGKDAVSSMLISLGVVARNPLAMAVWAGLLVFLVAVGFATGFLGLIYTAPIAGHATWHAYRDLIDKDS
ncbi:MAG: DUF2189 domain-containing protein [Betaproteobacteria bacterium]|nr:DUF2189 domain-containing protein [Betaproteobacteria bacterium]